MHKNNITLSIIIPTIGRDTLARTLMSIDRQIHKDYVDLYNDEIIVAADERGNWQYAEWLCSILNEHSYEPYRNVYRFFKQPTGKPVGQPLRNYGIEQATKSHIVFSGDDDVFTPDAFDSIRTNVCQNPDKVHLFKLNAWQCGVVPRDQKLYEGNIDVGCAVVPNDQSKIGRFTMRYAGDYDFIVETTNNFGGEENIVWCPEILTITRPERFLKKLI